MKDKIKTKAVHDALGIPNIWNLKTNKLDENKVIKAVNAHNAK